MIRGLLGLFVFAGVITAAIFFADHPGQVEIVWQGWLVETTVGVLAGAAVLAGLVIALLFWLVSLILGSPRALLRHRRERRRRAGYRALTRGMVAVAAGDPQEAQRCARRADALLADPPLTLLLSAQAAQLGGDETAAKRFFTAMLERPEMEFLGLRGLLNHALRVGDRGTALRLTERAAALRPDTTWAVESLFNLEAREGQWDAALETLAQAVKRRIIPRERARHHRGVILYELSLAALTVGERARGRKLAAQAHALTPDLAAPATHHARVLLQDHRTGLAAKAIERAWRTFPHPDLAQVYGAIHDGAPPLDRLKSFERLAAQNPDARETHLAVAEAALDAQLWGEARRHLEQALNEPAPPFIARLPNPAPFTVPLAAAENPSLVGPTPRLCLMMARLDEAEHGVGPESREWLDRAVTAMPDPRYVCTTCGGESLEWKTLCPHCGSFDALAWRTPAWAAAGSTLPILAKPPSTESRELPAGHSASG
ncbi:MAG TPA: heme biosynthesis HemY N-terminal domain-containing protein [Stellaceae bacterium]|nr:heme biosynthesis HemY N-terminal domain-containing protein [Stellaceae bacterium]